MPAAAVPLVFLHVRYQASVEVGPATAYGSDVAIILTLVAGAISAVLFGWRHLLRARLLWLSASALIGLFVVSCFWSPAEETTTHLVTAAKYAEYALIAPALVLLFRRRDDLIRFLWVYVVWCAAAGLWGLLQFLGLVNEFEGRRPGQREVSFLGHDDFGAFAASAFVVGAAALVLGERRRLAIAALAAGSLGIVLDASIAAYGGAVVAAAAAAVVGWRGGTLTLRRATALAGMLVVIGAGVNTLRGSDVTSYLSFLGIHRSPETTGVQTGSQRAVLFYIGLRIWKDHPWLGVGFERSGNRYQPYLADAKRRYPDEPLQTFPSEAHRWGTQNFWLQLAADVGIVGLALGLATFGAGLAAARAALSTDTFLALIAGGWVLVAAATWNAIGIVSGIPLEAITWIALGLAACAQCSVMSAKDSLR